VRPRASSETSLLRMQRQGRRDTKPELALRQELHKKGLRYFVDRSPLPELRRRADIVFPRVRVAVYVDGCFWHGCPVHATQPKANGAWWQAKLEHNRERDRDTNERLRAQNWLVLRFWEHDDLVAAADTVQATVIARRGPPL